MASSAIRCNVDCPSTLKNVLRVLDLILLNLDEPGKKKRSKQFQDFYSVKAVDQIQIQSSKAKTVSKNCVKLMNQSICCHRYKTAVKLLWILCQDRKILGSYIFKAAMFIFNGLSFSNKEEFMWNLHRTLQKIGLLNRKEVQLEYIIFGIQNCVPDLTKRTKEISLDSRIKSDVIDPLFQAYSSFTQYNEWCNSSDDTQLSQAKIGAESTILQLKKIVASQGDWDVFVIKLIKMLDFCGRGDEIEDVLAQYVQFNPNNINAHIYLCVYLYNHSSDNEKITFHLENLANLCPSDERVLLLLDKWKESTWKINKSLKINFMFLDYPSNGENIQAWQFLSGFLSQVKSRNLDDEQKIVLSLWKTRQKCWIWLHFNSLQVPHLSESEQYLTKIKTKVISYFDQEHEYIKSVWKRFPALQKAL